MHVPITPQKICNTKHAVELLTETLNKMEPQDQLKECMWVMLLDMQNNLTHLELVYMGSSHGTPVTTREIYRIAVEKSAPRIIIAHNHPSLSTEPSEADLASCRKLRRAGKLLDVSMLDFIIITKDGNFFSYYAK